MAKREVDRAKTAKALRKLRKVAERVSEPDAPKLTAWEQEFVAGVSTRLETYGSAFRDLSKGRAEEALSERQTAVARVIDKKTRPKKTKLDPSTTQSDAVRSPGSGKPGRGDPSTGGFRRSSFKPKAPPASRARVRHVEDDLRDDKGADANRPNDRRSGDKRPVAPAPSLKVIDSQATPPRPRSLAATKNAVAPRLRVIPGGKGDPGQSR